MRVLVLGGGPTGLAVARGLVEESAIPFVLFEREPVVGGLARTVPWEGHGRHDLGPHKIFSLDKALTRRVEAILTPGEWLDRPKKSAIYLGRFLPYPPSPFSLIGLFGLPRFVSMMADYGKARLHAVVKPGEAGTFEEDLQSRVGRGLYEALFKPIAMKLWDDPRNLDVKLARGRVQTPSVLEMLARLLRIRSSSDFEAMSFRYPRQGLQTLWDTIVRTCSTQGTFHVNRQVVGIATEGRRVTAVRTRDGRSGTEDTLVLEPDDRVVSTLPLGALPSLFGSGISEGTARNIRHAVRLNTLLLVFLKIDRPSLLEESWVFVPDPGIIFHRLSEQESFAPGMTPGGSIVCCEIMDSALRPTAKLPDEELIASARQGLAAMGYKGFSVLDGRVIRLPSSYPVYIQGFAPILDAILAELDSFENFRSIGRQGAFNYVGTLDSMDIGFGTARWLARGGGPGSEDSWRQERARTDHYPVLD